MSLSVNGAGGNVFAVTVREAEGQAAEIQITRAQTGLAGFGAGQNVAVFYNGRIVAAGRVVEPPADLFGPYQTLIARCDTDYSEQQCIDYGKSRLSSTVDDLFSDFDPESAESWLCGVAAHWYIDPATWSVSAVDILAGVSTLDKSRAVLLDKGQASGGAAAEFGPPAARMVGRLKVDFQQTASGYCNVAGRIPTIDTLDPSFASNLQSLLTTELSEGWTFNSGGYDHSVDRTEVLFDDLGTVYQYKYTVREFDTFTTIMNERRVRGALVKHHVDVKQLTLQYQYTQERSEEVEAWLNTGSPSIGPTQEVVMEHTLKDISGSGAPAYVAGRSYKEGALVMHNGELYRARIDHDSPSITAADPKWIRYQVGHGPTGPLYLHRQQRYFEKQPNNPDIFGPRSPSFFSTVRGQATINHLHRRMVNEARMRARQVRVKVRMGMDDAYDISVRHSIRVRIFTGGTIDRPSFSTVTGKVAAIEKVWPQQGTPYADVEVALSIGHASGGNFADRAYVEGDAAGQYVQAGTGWAITAEDPLINQYDLSRLSDPQASVASVRVGNRADAQIAAAASLISAGSDVRRCSADRPTWVTLRMNPISATDTIKRKIVVNMPMMGLGPRGF